MRGGKVSLNSVKERGSNAALRSQNASPVRSPRRHGLVLWGARTNIRLFLIDEGHEPFSAPHVIDVLRAERTRQGILLHIHAVNESRADRQEYDE